MIDRAALEAAATRSFAAAAAFRRGDAYRALDAAFSSLAGDDGAGAAAAAERVLAEDGWVGALIAPLVMHLRDDPWFEPPFRVNRDALRIGAILYESEVVSIAATILSADALAALSPPATVVVPGRLSVTRYVSAGAARLRRWTADPVAEDFTAEGAPPCTALAPLALADGMVLRLDGRTLGHVLAGARRDVVTLVATIRAGAAPFLREYRMADGALVRVAMTDDRAARTQMLLAALRLAGRHDAGACFEAATHEPAFFLRWAAMREWLALDARAALPRLRAMAEADAHAEVRTAAAATLAKVDARLAA